LNSFGNNEIVAEVSFIIATLVGFVSLPFLELMGAESYLVDVSANGGLVLIEGLFCYAEAKHAFSRRLSNVF
jgi:hypothetical protein